MRRITLLTIITVLALNSHAQQTTTYGELQAKMLHMKEKYSGLALYGKTDSLDIQQQILDYYARVPQEQIYLHTDKPYYVPGDTVWFRAHLVDAVTHTPISRSKYVYIELQDHQADTLVQRIIVKCDSDGVFGNALVLPRHLHGGNYTMAAYTQWMSNFPAERFCYKSLTVVAADSKEVSMVAYPIAPPSPTHGQQALQLAQRKGQLFIQLNKAVDKPMVCAIYGSGNLIVTDYTQGKVLRIDSQSLRPGLLNCAIVDRQTGDIIAESQTHIEARKPVVHIDSHSANDHIELTLQVSDADGAPVDGNVSLSVTDYDIVRPDTLQPTISDYLMSQPYTAALSDMIGGKMPDIQHGFQTTQTLSGYIHGVFFKRIKQPKLMLVRPDTGFRETFELGDSSRFTISGLDFADGVSYTLQGLRRTGVDRLVQLDVDAQQFPKLKIPESIPTTTIPSAVLQTYNRQASKQVALNRVYRTIELPEVVKNGRKHRPQKSNLMRIEAPRGIPAGDQRLGNASNVQQLLISLGMRVYYIDGEGYITTPDNAGVVVYVDNMKEEDHDYVLSLVPTDIKSIEYFTPNNAVNGLFGARPASFSGKVPGVLFIFLKDGSEIARSKNGRPRSMVTVRQQGYQIAPVFYSPTYKDKADKTRPDYRTTLYWNPKVTLDANGSAKADFYASDISKRYLITVEGVGNNGDIIYHQQVITENNNQ